MVSDAKQQVGAHMDNSTRYRKRDCIADLTWRQHGMEQRWR